MMMSDFRSQCIVDIQDVLGLIHGDKSSRLLMTKVSAGIRVYGGTCDSIAKYNVSFPGPFSYYSGGIQRAVSILNCVAGSAEIQVGEKNVEIRSGEIVVIGSEVEYEIRSSTNISYTITIIGDDLVSSYCSKAMGKPLWTPVSFDLVASNEKFSSCWNLISSKIDKILKDGRLSRVEVGSLVDYAIALLLETHPHNYSTCVFRGNLANPDAVREAKHFIEQNVDRAISVADVASFVGCGMRALHHGFCDQLGLSPRAYIYSTQRASARPWRADAAGERGSARPVSGELTCPECAGAQSMEAVAKKFPDIDGPWIGRSQRSSGRLTSVKIDLLRHHINMSLALPMTVCGLSRMVGMSSRRFAAAFRRAFGTSPAQYVIWERLKWACWLLVNTNNSIASVAAETGFNSQSYLTTALKGWNGQTPCELRKLSRASHFHENDLFIWNS